MNKSDNTTATNNPFHPDNLRIDVVETQAVTPRKIKKRRKQFTMLPMAWYERMRGVNSAQTYRVAWFLLYLHWKNNGDPIKLASGMLHMDGVPPSTKCWALRELERLGLITVEWRGKKSPIVRLLLMT